MSIILPHKIYYNINVYGIQINSEGADPDDEHLINLRYWSDRYRVNIDLPKGDDDAYSY